MATYKNGRKNIFRAGLFVIISLFITFYGVLWLRYFSIKPAISVVAEFTNSGPLSKGLQVYFKGISIGRISDVKYSKDFTNTLVYIDIFKKDINIPKKSYAEIKTEGLTGQKYIDLEPYGGKFDGELLATGDIIWGKPKYEINDIANIIVKEINKGRIDKIMNSIQNSLENTEKVTSNMAELTGSFRGIVSENRNNINTVTKNLVKSSEDAKKMMEDKKAMNDLKDSIANIKSITENVHSVVSDEDMQKSIKHSISTTDGLIQKINTNSDCLIFDTLKNTNRAAKQVNTLSCQTSELLSKRFLLLRLLFGRPGKDFQTCFEESQGKCNSKK